MKKVSVIIVTYNSKKYIGKCLCSILKYKDIEVIVVDNNSKDETVDILKQKYPQVKLIENKENSGFARACNSGAKKSVSEFLFFLNPDTEIINGDLERFVGFMRRNENIGILGPKLISLDGTLQRSYFPMLNLSRIFLKLLYLENFFPQYFDDRRKEVEMLTGAAILVRRKDFFEVGGFDERFPLYFEDFDLSRRIKKKLGKILYYYPELIIKHFSGASSKQDEFLSRKLGRESLRYYIKKYYAGGIIFLFLFSILRIILDNSILILFYLFFHRPGNFWQIRKASFLWIKEIFTGV